MKPQTLTALWVTARIFQSLFGAGLGMLAFAIWHSVPLSVCVIVFYVLGIWHRTIIQRRKSQ